MTADIHKKLRPFQKEGRDFVLKAFRRGDKGVTIGDEMGLGKTIQSLAVADMVPKKFGRVGILAPAGLCEKMSEEIAEFLPKKRDYTITLASYSSLQTLHDLKFFNRRKFDLVICDESHYLKSFESLRTHAVLGSPGHSHTAVADNTRFMLGLSGTWPPNRIGEVYPWLWATRHDVVKRRSYERFLEDFAGSVNVTPFGTTHKGVRNIAEFREAISDNLIYRKMDEVLKDIPKGTVINVPVECTAKMFAEEQKLFSELLSLAGYSKTELGLIYSDPNFLALLLDAVPNFKKLADFRRRQGLMKVKPVIEYMRESVLPETEKFILTAYHKDVAETYARLLSAHRPKIPVVLVHGGTHSKKDRHALFKQCDKAERVALVTTIDVVKEGHNLTGFTRAYLGEKDWRVYAIEQWQGRIRRFGQKHRTFWTHFNLNRGIEKRIGEVLKQKANDLAQIRGK